MAIQGPQPCASIAMTRTITIPSTRTTSPMPSQRIASFAIPLIRTGSRHCCRTTMIIGSLPGHTQTSEPIVLPATKTITTTPPILVSAATRKIITRPRIHLMQPRNFQPIASPVIMKLHGHLRRLTMTEPISRFIPANTRDNGAPV